MLKRVEGIIPRPAPLTHPLAQQDADAWKQRGVEVYSSWWYDQYKGERAALVKAGLVDPTMFPGDPGNGKVGQSYRDGQTRVNIRRCGTSENFEVRYSLSTEERKRREAIHDAEFQRGIQHINAEEEARRSQRDIEHLPASADAFRDSLLRMASVWLEVTESRAQDGDGGYRLSPASAQEVSEAIQEVFGAMTRAQVVFNKRARDEQIAGYRAKIAAADPEFQSVIAGICADALQR